MRKILFAFVLFFCFDVTLHAQVIWHANPDQSTNVNHFFRRFDSGNYPTDYCYNPGDQNGVTASKVTTPTDPTHGKVWKVNKPKNRKRGELARAEGDNDFYKASEGDDIYIGWRWKIDTESGPNITTECTVWQWKSEGAHDQNYPVNLEYDGDLTLNAWGPDYDNSSSQASMRTVLWRKAVPQNTWVTLVVRIKVDKDNYGGLVQFWYNGVAQRLTNSNSNKYEVNLSADKYTAFHRTNDGSGVYPKWGVYNKKSCSYNASAYFGDLKIGRSLSSVMPSGSEAPNQKPTVNLTSPSNGEVFELGETINLGATANDNDGTVAKVNFKTNGAYHSQDATGPSYSGLFTPSQAGTYMIGARAFDNNDGQTEKTITITVVEPNEAPTLTITSPNDGITFNLGETIRLSANANDSDGNVTKVNFKLNGAFFSQDLTGPDYSGTFTPSEVGSYVIGAVAFDNNNVKTEKSVTISVVEPNLPPTGVFEHPTFSFVDDGYDELYVVVDASDPNGQSDIKSVTLFIDGVEKRTETGAPYEWGHVTSGGTDNREETKGLATGNHLLEAVIEDNSGVRVTISKNIEVKLITSILENNSGTQIAIFPNPSNTGAFSLDKAYDFEIFNVSGDLVTSSFSDEINLQAEPDGFYFLIIENKTYKLVK